MKTAAIKSDAKTPAFKSTTDAISHITNRLNTESDFLELLLASITKARQTAMDEMDKALFNVLDWPTTLDDYTAYLERFRKWTPHQSGHPGWQDPETGYSQEVYDNLCHFYFLIDQGVGPNGTTIVQNIDGFKQWLVDYANLWGDFLNTTESMNDKVWQSFQQYAPYYRIQDCLVNGKPNNPSGWLTFNQFFARELNPGLRPIDSANDNTVVVSPADCTYRKMYKIDANSNITDDYANKTNTIIKKTHIIGNIADLLKGSPYANAFANGTFVHYFLGPYSYHRFHAPISGMLKECRAIDGLTYLEVNIANGQYDAPDNADSPTPPEKGYQFNQARGVLTIDASESKYGNMGVVGVVPVGMCQVSGVHMTATVGNKIAKGEEFGYFLFGGSDIILLFQEGKAPIIDETKDSYRYYGTSISGAPYSEK